MKIIFVCTGNTCRSPMAEMAAKQLIGGDHNFGSAGVLAIEGSPISKKAIQAMENAGITYEEHFSRNISKEDIEESDLIITMTEQLKRFLPKGGEKKAVSLKEFAYGKKGDVEDPFGGGLKDYERCLEEIIDCIERMKEKLV